MSSIRAHHVWKERLRSVDDSPEVHVDHLLVVLEGRGEYIPGEKYASVVDQSINAAEPRSNIFCMGENRSSVGHIDHRRIEVSGSARAQVSSSGELRLRRVRQCQVCARLSELSS
ncbi:hypothetical protein Rhow_004581 [Rhodococcus wratislaviensis]|uniref:Uncharacterized protein n=1 Tax=Rhodococcus wratislaviensis TaxID=44752 RepID=A0A402CBH1_RHOWR|nr:hypothetical protein Rhow_004581 [Rhodococcus wratislaviensis]